MPKEQIIPFDQQIKHALKYYDNPDRLATESVLASAYFLGNAGAEQLDSSAGEQNWGEILCRAMVNAADGLWGAEPPRNREEIEAAWADILQSPGAPRYNYLILELRYFRRFFQPRSLQQIWQEFLQQSRAEFYRDVDRAIEALGESLLRHLRPGARQEQAPAVVSLVGRTALHERIARTLREGKSVALSGLSGIGKTSLAAAIVEGWPSTHILWFTVRPELNDGLYQFLFAIGGFLHHNGQDLLWRALAANQGKLEDPALLLTLARRDLAQLAPQRPLLVLDEVDLWSDDEGVHRALQELIAGLQEVAPFLLVGQRVNLAANTYVTLTGFDDEDIVHFLTKQEVHLAPEEIQRLMNVTGGNPRLLWLCVDLLTQGEPLDDIVGEASDGIRSFDGFLNLLWLRLDKTQRQILHALCVYPTPAPRDLWPNEALEALTARHLLFHDGMGSVFLLPSVRSVLYRALSAEQRELLHLEAAGVNAALGDYTMAAYHFQRADRPDMAVKVWFPHRSQEIERGAAATALTVFTNASGTRLSKKERRTLDVIRAELFHLSGDLHTGLDILEQTDWQQEDPSELTMGAQRLRGDFQDALGMFDDGLHSYAESLTTAARLQQRIVDLHVRIGRVHVRQRRLAEAAQTVQQARCQAEMLQGLVLEEQGDLSSAQHHYGDALKLAEELEDEVSLAEINRCLSNLFGRRGELEQALKHADQSIAYYRQIGDLVKVALVRSNMAANYLDAGQYADVLTTGQQAFDFYRQIGHSHGTAATACNLAEASFELGDGAEAERYAGIALEQEEPLAFPYAYYTLALVRSARGEAEEAGKLLELCCSLAQDNEDIFIEAYARLKMAEITATAAESIEAARQASDLFTRLGLDEMAGAARELAQAEGR